MSDPGIYNKVVVVDQNDVVIGSEMMFDAIEKGVIRRASRVYVFNESGKLLVQRRSKNLLKPLLLDQSAAGHVDEGETYLQAAERELFEELGIKNVKLEEIVTSFRTTNFFNAVYKTIVTDDLEINFDPVEVDEVFWFEVDELDEKMRDNPNNFTPEFLEAWQKLRGKLIA